MDRTSITTALVTVYRMNEPRGYRPDADDDAQAFADAAKLGLLTTPTRGWGYRLTPEGRKSALATVAAERALQKAREAELEAAGFDPNKRVCDMTPDEVQRFIAATNEGRI